MPLSILLSLGNYWSYLWRCELRLLGCTWGAINSYFSMGTALVSGFVQVHILLRERERNAFLIEAFLDGFSQVEHDPPVV